MFQFKKREITKPLLLLKFAGFSLTTKAILSRMIYENLIQKAVFLKHHCRFQYIHIIIISIKLNSNKNHHYKQKFKFILTVKTV